MNYEYERKPRFVVYEKIEAILRNALLDDGGVPLRPQKVLLTTVPSVVKGDDLVDWLQNKLHVEETVEALHLANMFCRLGYLVPFSDPKQLEVKDDSTILRIQSPYYWPSNNWEPDNIQYAIFLDKRILNNKNKYGLEDYEQDALNKLKHILADNWDFIHMQSEEQYRLRESKSKVDRLIDEYQEKFFWRVNRPPPNTTKVLEEGVRRCFQPVHIKNKLNSDKNWWQKKLEASNNHWQRPRSKCSQAGDSLISWVQARYEHDAQLVTPAPSNPWVSDDLSYMMVNSHVIDVPAESRVKRWALSFPELLRDPTGLKEFETYIKSEYSEENLYFYLACERLKYSPVAMVPRIAKEIENRFLISGAPHQINIDSKTMDITTKNLMEPSRFAFDAAQEHIFLLMKKDTYPRFLRSDQHKNLLLHAVQPTPRKKLFAFGSVRKKSSQRSRGLPMVGSNLAAAEDVLGDLGCATAPSLTLTTLAAPTSATPDSQQPSSSASMHSSSSASVTETGSKLITGRRTSNDSANKASSQVVLASNQSSASLSSTAAVDSEVCPWEAVDPRLARQTNIQSVPGYQKEVLVLADNKENKQQQNSPLTMDKVSRSSASDICPWEEMTPAGPSGAGSSTAPASGLGVAVAGVGALALSPTGRVSGSPAGSTGPLVGPSDDRPAHQQTAHQETARLETTHPENNLTSASEEKEVTPWEFQALPTRK